MVHRAHPLLAPAHQSYRWRAATVFPSRIDSQVSVARHATNPYNSTAVAASYRQAICSASHTGAMCMRCIDRQAPRFGACTSCPANKASAALAWLASKLYEVLLAAAFLAMLYVTTQKQALPSGSKSNAATAIQLWAELQAYVLVSDAAMCAAAVTALPEKGHGVVPSA